MKITVIGAGNMGGAIAYGALKSGFLAAQNLTVATPTTKFVDRLSVEGIKVNYTNDNAASVEGADIIIVAVKPWLAEEVLRQISERIDRKSQCLVSIVAGLSFAQMNEYTDSERLGAMGFYRVIPNTAVSLGKSVTFIASEGTSSIHDEMINTLFEQLGVVFNITEEKIVAVTALSSSGIAYAFKYIEAAVKGGGVMGIGQSEALSIVIQTMKGALALLETNGDMPSKEIDKVTTPGGITLRGLAAMEQHGFTDAVIAGLLATKWD